MGELAKDIRWGIEQRLEFIEFQLFWEGGINRSDITRQFKISVPQASNDLKRYEELTSGNLVYDKSRKRYLASAAFTPKFLSPNADQYLSRLRDLADHTLAHVDSWIAVAPAAESMPLPHRRVEVNVLRKLVETIRYEQSVRVLYQSMNPQRPDPVWRWISPHAFANDGLRWHVRAYCHLDRKFKDFLLSRLLNADENGKPEAASDSDKNWQEYFDVILAPNPRLSQNQQNVIAQDYSMENGEIVIPVRKSFLYYFQKRLRLDVGSALDNPRETPVIVQNEDAFKLAISEADQ